ncbi:MAG: pyruvate kinase [Clostridia bacterium]|nr:pyruvate kinase [Clostridia bacterium]
MKKTKIICTLGPASESEEVLSKMIDAGMNVARLNFSHGTHEEHAVKIDLIKRVREKKKVPLPILLDTKGPEFRIKTFAKGKVNLKDGDTFTFTTDEVEGDKTRVSVSFAGICEQMFPGDKILLNNGLIIFEVVKVEKPNVICKVIVGGELSNRKSMFFPDKELEMEYLSEQDKADLKFGVEQGIDFVACSFVSKAQDLIDVRNWLRECGDKDDQIELIAKIESRSGVNNLDSIIDVCGGVMVARGDLGVEVPFEELPAIQKTIINKCRRRGKRSITATEMLESMIKQPRPTRAEISDVANAVYDGSSAIMLSGETAAGMYPVEAVKAMAKIAQQAELNTSYIAYIKDSDYHIKNLAEALSHSACTLAEDIGAKVIVVCTRTGGTARTVSRFRPMIDIIGMTTDERAYRKLALSWGVIPVMSEEFYSVDVLFHYAKRAAIDTGLVSKGDRIVLTGGTPNGKSGNSNLINVETIG